MGRGRGTGGGREGERGERKRKRERDRDQTDRQIDRAIYQERAFIRFSKAYGLTGNYDFGSLILIMNPWVPKLEERESNSLQPFLQQFFRLASRKRM